MSGLPELQDAVRQIPGIATAVIRWPDPLGPASLRVEFDADADHQAVGEAVIRTLVDVGEVDLATMQLEREEHPTWSTRPVFTTLVLDRLGSELSVEVGLYVGGHEVTGVAHLSDHDPDADQLTTVARATVEALLRVDRTQPYAIRHVERAPLGDTDVVSVLVDLLDEAATGGPLVGTALVTRDAREATVRATLDAVNRHVDVRTRGATTG
ncbi:MAG TPA: hypothetical protein VMM13_18640 [Euzebya sp.]|nr:hypothetical protein [Euzebya sp.]